MTRPAAEAPVGRAEPDDGRVVEIPAGLVRRLYELPPERFVVARDEEVARVRRAGDRDLAEAIGRLRRPTLAAWLVNLLAWQRPEEVAELLELGRALREAQHRLQGEQLRRLAGQRRAVINSLVAQARRLAVAAGRPSRDNLPLAEVEATLSAALSDQDLAAAVRAGRLTKAAEYAGFGEPPRPRLRVIDGGARPAGAEAQAGTGGAGEPQRPPSRGAPGATGRGVRPERQRAGRTGGAGQPEPSGAGPDTAGGPAAGGRAGRPGQAQPATPRRADTPARAELRRATAAEQDAVRALAELGRQLDELRERHAAAQIAVRAARLRRRQAERAVERSERRT